MSLVWPTCTRSPLSGLSPGPARAPTLPDFAQTDVFALAFEGSAGDSEKPKTLHIIEELFRS
jgi:hypothetical protein